MKPEPALYAPAPEDIGYLDETVPAEYLRQRRLCLNFYQLVAFVERWSRWAPDAVEVVSAMKVDDFDEYLRGDMLEEQGTFAGPDWVKRFGALAMPAAMFRATFAAEQFHVPFGTAWIQLVRAQVLVCGEDRCYRVRRRRTGPGLIT